MTSRYPAGSGASRAADARGVGAGRGEELAHAVGAGRARVRATIHKRGGVWLLGGSGAGRPARPSPSRAPRATTRSGSATV